MEIVSFVVEFGQPTTVAYTLRKPEISAESTPKNKRQVVV
jgi:hypothetical protein